MTNDDLETTQRGKPIERAEQPPHLFSALPVPQVCLTAEELSAMVGENKQKGCRVCDHKGQLEIDAMLLNGTAYTSIIHAMATRYPNEKSISKPILSIHKNKHLVSRVVHIVNELPDGTKQHIWDGGHLVNHKLAIDKNELVPQEEVVSVREALGVVINSGVQRIISGETKVTPAQLIQALELCSKLGLNSGMDDVISDAWASLDSQHKKRRVRKARRITEEVELEDAFVEEARILVEGL